MHVNIEEARVQLPSLIAAVKAGEDVVLTDGCNPVVRLVPCSGTHHGKRPLGLLRGKVVLHGDMLDPPADETEYLLRSPKNAQRLQESLDELGR
ncbi:MAG: hypothetical protein BWK76_21740 [Desulfobulbaceae bacterium A2]|nr:MAG: hypothetical protein BWK76_21740 [Desulfobulbaceae bacterium A2]